LPEQNQMKISRRLCVVLGLMVLTTAAFAQQWKAPTAMKNMRTVSKGAVDDYKKDGPQYIQRVLARNKHKIKI
jgi:hypothetical protein